LENLRCRSERPEPIRTQDHEVACHAVEETRR
jgi:hypothetical protein